MPTTKLRSLNSQSIKNKTLLLRTDFNCPVNQAGTKILDDARLHLALPQIKQLISRSASVVICSHLGSTKNYPLKPIHTKLKSLLNQPIHFHPGKLTRTHQQIASSLQPGEILLLDNPRLNSGETKNTPRFSKQLASLADIFVNDAFSVSHRDHASVTGVAKILPSFAGSHFLSEYQLLSGLLNQPPKPFVTIVGGAKITTKIGVVSKLAKISDVVLTGGGLANHFIKAQGLNVANSYLETSSLTFHNQSTTPLKAAQNILNSTKNDKMLLHGYIPLPKILHPIDTIAAKSPSSRSTKTINLSSNHFKRYNGLMYLDIGPKTAKLYSQIILQASTIFWNGPMGAYEHPAFMAGTKKIATSIAKSPATSIIGGGDTLSALDQLRLTNRYDHLTSSGGAALQFLSDQTLPGLKPLLT